MTPLTEILIRPATNRDCENVKALVFGVLNEFGLEAERGGTDADLDDIEANYFERGGYFEVLESADGKILGTVGLYPQNSDTVELRKMYFLPELRGRGAGKAALERMIEKARELGYKRIYLETAKVLLAANALYKSFGFKETDEMHALRCDAAYYLDL